MNYDNWKLSNPQDDGCERRREDALEHNRDEE